MTTSTLQPDDTTGIDTYISASAAALTFNFGVSTTINVGTVTTNEPRRGLIKFDISSLPAGATINSATLTLFCEAESNATDRNVAVYRALTQWFEGAKSGAAPDASTDGSTWNLRNANGSVAWGAAGGQSATDYAAVATDTKSITGAATSFDFNVLADVAAWYAGSATNFGWFIINGVETTSNSQKQFTSSGGATAGNRPKLVIDYTAGSGAVDNKAQVLEIGPQLGVMTMRSGGARMMNIG